MILGVIMLEVFAFLLLLVVSLFIVIKAADFFVDNLVDIGVYFGISEIILGVTAAAIGTSLPEFGSAMIAILTGTPNVGVGCSLGANIWNIGGILGFSAIFAGSICVSQPILKREGLMALITVILLYLSLLIFGNINIISASVLIIAYIIYMYFLIKCVESEECAIKTDVDDETNIKKKILFVLIGLISLAVGCKLIVTSVVNVSDILNIPDVLAGMFLAFGTTVPEFFAVFSSAKRGLSKLAVGTILGSNIFNILIGLGVPALFTTITVDKIAISYDVPLLIFITLLLLIMGYIRTEIKKTEGIILVLTYFVFIVVRLFLYT